MTATKSPRALPANAGEDAPGAMVTVLKGTPAFRPLTYTLAMQRVVERAADQPYEGDVRPCRPVEGRP